MPEDQVTLWQWCTFSFVEPIFGVAMRRRLELEDVWSLSPFFKHKNLFHKYLEYRERWDSFKTLEPAPEIVFQISNPLLDMVSNNIQFPRSHPGYRS